MRLLFSGTRPSTLPNPLTALRLLLLPGLWWFALSGQSAALVAGLALALLGDALDGRLAAAVPRFSGGAGYDSLADRLLSLSVVAWVLQRHPALVVDERSLLLAAGALYGVSLVVGWVRLGRPASLHLYSGRGAGVIQASFALHALVATQVSEVGFALAVGCFIVAAAEELATHLLLPGLEGEGQLRSVLSLVRWRG